MSAPNIIYPPSSGGGGGGISGSGSSPYVAVWSGTSAITTGSLVDTGSRVGILQTSPVTTFQVGGNAVATGSPVGAFCTLGSNSRFTADDGTRAVTLAANGTSAIVGTTTAHDLLVQTNGATKLFVQDSTSRVGIGNTDPATTVEAYAAVTGEVRASGDASSVVSSYTYNNLFATFAPALRMSRSRGTRAAPTAVNALDTIGTVGWHARGTTDRQVANIQCTAPANAGGDQISGQLTFATTQTTDALPVVRLTINPAGNVGIGTTSPVASMHVIGTSVASVTTASPGILRVDGGAVPNKLFFGSFSNSPFGMYAQTNDATYPLILQPAGGSVGIKVTSPATNTLDVSTAGWGVKLPSTPGASGAGTENILDCYEEADWTPVDKSGASIAIAFTNAKVTRIGRLVHCCFVATYPPTVTSSAPMKISLPFACTGTNASPLYPGTAAIGFNSGTATSMVAQVVSDTSGTYLYFHNQAADIANSSMTNSKAVQVSVTYQIY
jgi:hypothetical protein